MIPYVVAEEYRTKTSARIESLTELRETLKRLRRALPTNLHSILSDFEGRIATEFDTLEASARRLFDEWRNRTHATIVNPSPDQASKVFAKYFAGDPPFKSAKARQDIPDAFIVEAALDLALDLTAGRSLFAVSNDKGVAGALNDVPNITVFKSVKALLDSEVFSAALVDAKTEYETANVEGIVQSFLRDWAPFKKKLEDDVGTRVSGRTLSYRNPHYDEKDGLDELYISLAEDVYDWTFDGESDYLGEGVILVNFDARVSVDVDDPMSGHYFDDDGNVDTTREVRVSGAVTITLDATLLQQVSRSWSAEELQAVADVSVDELYDIELATRSY